MEQATALSILTSGAAPEERRSAAEILMQSEYLSDSALHAFAQGLLDDDSGVQDICSYAFVKDVDAQGDSKAKAVAPIILHPDIEVRNLAGDILTRLGGSSVQALAQFLYNEDFDVRKYACDIIGLVGTQDDAELILPLLDDKDVNARYSAIETLGNLRALNAIGHILGLYAHDEEVRPFVIEALGKIGGDVAQSFLVSTLKNEKDTLLRIAAIDALAMCGEQSYIGKKLVEVLPTVQEELQAVVVKAIVAINMRSGEALSFPLRYRHIAQSAVVSDDTDESQAGILALGDLYQSSDIPYLIHSIRNHGEEIVQHVVSTLVCNSPSGVVEEFLVRLIADSNGEEANVAQVLSVALPVAECIPEETIHGIVKVINEYSVNTSAAAMGDVLNIISRLNMSIFLQNIDELLSSDNSAIVEEALEIVRLCESEQLIDRLQELSFRDDAVGLHAREVLEWFASR